VNPVYRLIWNTCLGSWSVASELTAARGKRGRSSRGVLCGAALSVIAASTHAQTLPTGGEIAAGQGTIEPSGNTLTITQNSRNLVINWQQFNVGNDNVVNFAQADASAIALNRVLGSDPSEILGQINATGQVWLLNPNGVLFGQNSQVSVGGLVVSTLNLSDADFLSGRRTFNGESAGSVINHGNLTAQNGGYVALLGGRVSNQGLISARLGTVALGAGERITLDFAGDALLKVSVDQGALGALAENHQLIQADGGQVLMTARATSAVLDHVVNNTGIIEARTVERQGGVIKLLGGFEGGTVNVAGTLDASAPDGGDGGFIDTSGHKVSIDADARITTAAAAGTTGTWLIDPNDYRIAASGGDITGAALAAQLASNNIVIQSIDGADTNGNGDIFVNDAVSWGANTTLTLNAVRHIEVNAAITNSGSGKLVLRADMEGSGVGTVNFGGGLVSMTGGRTDLYYNPVSFTTPTDYSSNITGTRTAWMLVNDVNQLQAMNTNLAGVYALGRDIDASATSSWNAGAGFVPIGTSATRFTGMLDGLNHTITGLSILRPSTDHVGLFGVAGTAGVGGTTIRNVGLVDGNVSGNNRVGALLGWNVNAAVSNSYSTGAVNGSANVGGLIGYNDGPVSRSYATGTVSGSNEVGGLIGTNYDSVTNSYAAGAVSGVNMVGGLVGTNINVVSRSYATGAVNGVDQVGGLIGLHLMGFVSQSYASGAVSGSTKVGGLVGSRNDPITQSFWDTQTSGTAVGVGSGSSTGVTGLTTAQMMQQASFVGWNFTTDWWLSETNTRPFLRSEYSTTLVNAHQLQLMALDLNADYVLAADIDMSELTRASGLWNIATGFVPIGNVLYHFTGTFDGLNHTIHDLVINRPGEDLVGLFGYADGATISNVGLVGGDVTGFQTVGSLLAAGSSTTTVRNSYATGTVSGDSYVGGLIGATNGSVNDSYATGAVSSASWVGGLIGSAGGPVTNSYATGAVSGDWVAGGLVGGGPGSLSNSYATGAVNGISYLGGLAGTSTGTINDSYATGAVSGNDNLGGLVGSTFASAVSRSYSTGAVSGTDFVGGLIGFSEFGSVVSDSYASGAVSGNAKVGGLVGGNDISSVSNSYASGAVSGNAEVGGLIGINTGSVSQGFWDTQTSGMSTGIGSGTASGATGLTTAQMMQEGIFAAASWDIAGAGGSSAVWRIYEGQTRPLLRSFLAPLTVTVDDASKTYDGVAWGGGSGVAYAGFRAGESVADLLGAFAYEGTAQGARNAGSYTLRGSGQYSGQQGYDIEYVASTLTIDKRALTIGALGLDRIYDGTTAANVMLSDDRLSGDALTLAYAAAFGDKNAGEDKAVSVTSITVSGTDAANYTWNTTASTTADIARATLVVTGATAANRVYDGTTHATISGAALVGVFGTDAVTLTNATVGSFADKHVGTGKGVSTTMGLSDLDADNYTLTQPLGLSADISARQLLISAVGDDRTYDGSSLATVSLSDDRIDGDELSIDHGSAHFVDAAAGNDKRIDVLGIAVSGADAGNYLWNLGAQTVADIFPVGAPLALQAILPEIAPVTRSGYSLSQDFLLINRGIRLPDGFEKDAAQE
jgi:filamentous hemagglutinin family protein